MLTFLFWAVTCYHLYVLYWDAKDVTTHMVGIGVTAGVSALGWTVMSTIGRVTMANKKPRSAGITAEDLIAAIVKYKSSCPDLDCRKKD